MKRLGFRATISDSGNVPVSSAGISPPADSWDEVISNPPTIKSQKVDEGMDRDEDVELFSKRVCLTPRHILASRYVVSDDGTRLTEIRIVPNHHLHTHIPTIIL